ncbi:MAG: hypothetical protein IJU03_04765 [Thermoguttaceae bacterium]|nr:hypothetical protein [Thermoguttaceae bacterium]
MKKTPRQIEWEKKGRADERLRTLKTLLTIHSPETLLKDPKFKALGYAQPEINAALETQKKPRVKSARKKTVVSDANREMIRNFRLLDDIFMRRVLRDNVQGVQDIIRIVLQRQDLNVVSVRTEVDYPNLLSRGVRLDVLAKDDVGNLYNIEIQRDSRGLTPKRVRYNLSAIDWNDALSDDDFEKIVETWVIFISEKDVFNNGAPFVDVERYFVGTDVKFGDGQHVRFVSAAYVADDPIGNLMANFRETDPDKMTIPSLAKPVKILKSTKIGVEEMSSTLDEMRKKEREGGREEGREEGRVQTIGLLLASHSPETLMHDPQFLPLGVTQAEIDAALALNR